MKYALLALALTLGTAARADSFATGTVLPLYTQSNDRDANVDTYALSIVNNAPAAFLVLPNGQANGAQSFSFSDIATRDGAAILEGQGHKVVIMQGQLDGNMEGRFHMSYLANGLTNKYETCDMLLKRDGNSWIAQNAYNGRKITAVKVITWSLGLRTLQGICQ